jgi:hypothetical protein
MSEQLPRIWRWPYAAFGDEAKWDDDRASGRFFAMRRNTCFVS